MPSMKKWIDAAVAQFRGRSERREVIALHARILPEDLRDRLLEGIAQERTRILARLEVIDESMDRLGAMRLEARAAQQAVLIPVAPPAARPRIRLDGSRSERPAASAPTCYMIGKEAIEAGQTIRAIERHLARFKAERLGRVSELGDLRRLDAELEQNLLSSLIRLGEQFREPVLIGALARKVRLGGTFGGYSDASGSPLPPEALGPDGRPDLPTRLPRPIGPLVT